MTALAEKPYWLLLLILMVYGGLHIVLRLVISPGVELDEAEQLVLSQRWALGYTDQPPLYTWLVLGFQAIFGVGILSLALLKNLLLGLTHCYLFLSARIILRDNYLALLASLSLWLIPQFAWESQRDLTHSVLVTSLSSAFFYVMLRLLASGQTRYYLLLGVLLGLGILSKHSFLLGAAALGIAALCQPDGRRRLLDRRLILACGLAVIIVLPHLTWFSGHFNTADAPTIRKLGLHSGGLSLLAIGKGLRSLLWASISFLTPYWLICLLAFPQLARRRQAGVGPCPQVRHMPKAFLLTVVSLLGIAVIGFGVTHFKDRWMQPFLLFVPLFVFVRLQDVGGPSKRGLRLFTGAVGFCGLAFLLALLGQAWVAPWFGMYSRLHAPFGEVARQLRQAGFTGGTMIAETTFIGGNLRLVFPDSRVLTPELRTALDMTPKAQGQCLVVWEGDEQRPLPPPMHQFLTHSLGTPPTLPANPRYIAPRLRGAAQRRFPLSFILSPAGMGRCR